LHSRVSINTLSSFDRPLDYDPALPERCGA
jgi:hypothetical protein